MTERRKATELEGVLETATGRFSGIAIAYSGGMDSTALLHAAIRVFEVRRIRAIHVCHHMQPMAERWAAECRARCRAWDIDFTRLDVKVAPGGHGPEANAREQRYRALAGEIRADEALATAHHAHDQAETFLLQALRGSGVSGLAGMPMQSAFGKGWLWRPWLAIERGAIERYARQNGLAWCEDPSNADAAVARGYLRQHIWPSVETRWPAAAHSLARSARRAAQASEAIRMLAELDLDAAVTQHGSLLVEPLHRLSSARQSEAIRRWLVRTGYDVPSERVLDAIRSLLHAREHNGPRVRFAGTEIRLFDAQLFVMTLLSDAPVASFSWSGRGRLVLPAEAGVLIGTPEDVFGSGLEVRFRAGGEHITTAAGATRRLKDVLREARMPPWIRQRMPLVYRKSRLIAVADYWSDPALRQATSGVAPHLEWHHALVGAPDRVAAASAFG